MKTLPIAIVILSLIAGMIPYAYADCHKEGKTYPTNAEVDGFRCRADGRWEKA